MWKELYSNCELNDTRNIGQTQALFQYLISVPYLEYFEQGVRADIHVVSLISRGGCRDDTYKSVIATLPDL